MRAGLTYDLKDDYLAQGFSKETCAEFDPPETIDAIEQFLKSRGLQVERIGHAQALMKALTQGKRWDFVFNIAEGLHGRGREALVPALLDAHQIPYVFSDPLVLALTLDKAMTKRVVRDAGIPTAEFILIPDLSRNPMPIAQHPETGSGPGFPFFVKPNAEGTGKGISAKSLAHTEKELLAAAADIHARFSQPAIAEAYLPGREFTVGITGTGDNARIVGVMEILLNDKADPQGYTYDNKQQYEERVRYALADDQEGKRAGEVALAAWQALGCRDGGRADIRSDAQGNPHFLEVNPLAGLHPTLGDLVILSKLAGVSYSQLLGRILDSALSDTTRFSSTSNRILTAYA